MAIRDIDIYTNNVLAHANGHKYIKREKVNGEWRYWYPADIKNTNKLLSRETTSMSRVTNRNSGSIESHYKTTREVGRLDRALGMDKKYKRDDAETARDAAKAEADASNAKRESVVKNAMSDGKLDEKERGQITSANNEHNARLEEYRQAIKEYEDADANFGSTPIGKVSKSAEKAKSWLNNLFDTIEETVSDAKDTAEAYKDYRRERGQRDRHAKQGERAEAQYDKTYKRAMTDGRLDFNEIGALSDLQGKYMDSNFYRSLYDNSTKSAEKKLKSTRYGETVSSIDKKIQDAKDWVKKLFKGK